MEDKIERAVETLEAKKAYYAEQALKFAGSETGLKFLIRQGACAYGAAVLKERRKRNGVR